tara:strand:- start:515 stop:793 length:279 start_codon:yes stop_codon:yes gene_type:complete
MGLWALVTSLAKALAAYWTLKAERYRHDVVEQSRTKIETLEEQIESLRDSGSECDAQYADRLRERIVFEKAYFKHLSAECAKYYSRNRNSDS